MIKSCVLAALLAFAAAPALAQERPLTDDEVLALADSGAIWCENWSDQTRDCESLYMLRRNADGSLMTTAMFTLNASPEIRVVLADPVTLENGRLCGSGSTDDLNIRATLAGQPSTDVALMVRMALAESMAEYADTTICQQLLTSSDPTTMSEIITSDDVRLYDFESTYRVGDADSGFLLRAPSDEGPTQGMTDL